MSVISSCRLLNGANLPPKVALNVPATSWFLKFSMPYISNDWFGFLVLFCLELDISSSPSHCHFLCLLQECSLSCGRYFLIAFAVLPICSQSDCDASCLGCAISTFWMVCVALGNSAVLGCYTLHILGVSFFHSIAVGSTYLYPCCLCIPS